MSKTPVEAPLRILLVEDSEHDRLAFGRAFKKSQVASEITYHVRAEQALEELSAGGETAYDLLVTDYKLPGMTGLDLCQELLARGAPLPLVLLTGTGSEHLAVRALKAGVSDYIVKDLQHGYLDLLPVVLPEVVRQFDDRLARQQADNVLREYSERLEATVKERTRELREAQERLIRQEKLAVLGKMAGGVSHELRNPLGVIKNAVYLLNMLLQEAEPKVQDALQVMEKQVQVCDKIISSLLDFARTKDPERQEVDVSDVVHRAILGVLTPQNVQLEMQLDQSLPVIMADPDQLIQVFVNLLLNGFQAMPDGGRMLVRSEAPEDGWVSVSLTDTGTGISEENLEKLFEPLFTTKLRGVGLGLAVTLTLVEGHGGEILVHSELEKGSTFTVSLPVT
jgi:signal transduction histidine kinase